MFSRQIQKVLFFILLVLPLTVAAYGNRNWLTANQDYSKKISDNTYSWGYNYRMNGRHTTVQLKEDRAGWMHNGNVRGDSANGVFHWKKLKTAK